MGGDLLLHPRGQDHDLVVLSAGLAVHSHEAELDVRLAACAATLAHRGGEPRVLSWWLLHSFFRPLTLPTEIFIKWNGTDRDARASLLNPDRKYRWA